MTRSANEFLEISINKNTFIPNFVNMAFACELYLKTILEYKTQTYPRTHDLEILYNDVVKEIDEADFLVILEEEIHVAFAANDMDIMTIYAKTDLESMFEQHKLLFEDWRYIFDGKVKKPYVVNMTLDSFAKALKRYIEENINDEVTP